jgi:hypothetical protein
LDARKAPIGPATKKGIPEVETPGSPVIESADDQPSSLRALIRNTTPSMIALAASMSRPALSEPVKGSTWRASTSSGGVVLVICVPITSSLTVDSVTPAVVSTSVGSTVVVVDSVVLVLGWVVVVVVVVVVVDVVGADVVVGSVVVVASSTVVVGFSLTVVVGYPLSVVVGYPL